MSDYLSELNSLFPETTSNATAEDWVDVEGGYNKVSHLDSNNPIMVNNKDINVIDIPIITCGENNSELITFIIDRYFEGVDLSEKMIQIVFKNSISGSVSNAVNVQRNSTHIKFGWLVDNMVTSVVGDVDFIIQAISTKDGLTYTWKTRPAKLNISDSLNPSDIIVVPTNSWYEDFIGIMDSKIAQTNEMLNETRQITNDNALILNTCVDATQICIDTTGSCTQATERANAVAEECEEIVNQAKQIIFSTVDIGENAPLTKNTLYIYYKN